VKKLKAGRVTAVEREISCPTFDISPTIRV